MCGATCSGKTTLCNLFRTELKHFLRVAFIPADSFYKNLTDEQRQLAYSSQYDFDHPEAIAWDELTEKVQTLKMGTTSVQIPKYDFATHSRIEGPPSQGPDGDVIKGSSSGGELIRPADVIIVEGILIYAAGPELRDEMDLKIFVDCDSDVRL